MGLTFSIGRPFQYVDSGLPALESFLALFLDNFYPSLFSILELLMMLDLLDSFSGSLFFSLTFLAFFLFCLLSKKSQLYLSILVLNFISAIVFFNFLVFYFAFPLSLFHSSAFLLLVNGELPFYVTWGSLPLFAGLSAQKQKAGTSGLGWSSREGCIASEVLSLSFHHSCFLCLLSYHSLSHCLRSDSLRKWTLKQQFPCRELTGNAPGSTLRRGWRK